MDRDALADAGSAWPAWLPPGAFCSIIMAPTASIASALADDDEDDDDDDAEDAIADEDGGGASASSVWAARS